MTVNNIFLVVGESFDPLSQLVVGGPEKTGKIKKIYKKLADLKTQLSGARK